jgi:DNA polymerase-4
MDAFFASVECTHNPTLKGKPVIVGGQPGGRGVVVSATYEARAYGVRTAMPTSQAYRLCPQAVFVPRNFDRYREASEQIRTILETFSPWVEMASIDEAFVDLSGSEQVLGPPQEAAQKIQGTIRCQLDLPCSIGVAPSKLVAKIACEEAKPRGLIEVHPGEEAAFLAPLPVTAVPGIGRQTAARLDELRIRTCGQLAQAPLLLLQRLLGRHASSLQRRARGIDRSPVRTKARQAVSISRSTTFAEDSRDPAFLRATLYRLVERVGHTLRHRNLSAACIGVQIRWADFSTRSHQCTLSCPSASNDVIYQTACELLDHLLTKSRQRVRLLGVRASHFSPQALQLPLLLSERAKEQRDLQLLRCLDQIRDRHGFRSIQNGMVFSLRNRSKERHLAEDMEDGSRDLLP